MLSVKMMNFAMLKTLTLTAKLNFVLFADYLDI